MKLHKRRVIDSVTAEIERRKLAQAQWDLDVANAEAAALAAWERETKPQWKAYRDAITKAIRDRVVIRPETLPRCPEAFRFRKGRWVTGGYYARGKFTRGIHWEGGTDHDFGPRPRIEGDQLNALLDFLKTITDEEVTFDAIVRAGFKTGFQQAFKQQEGK